ncbi:uncharacterized protein LOC135463748 [Liolophura sinensis]|uniref:uncharacterized protein LOC135463748 n=1 Tax=Liolophura sinensis TaxID=3198878 RepID=UPI00315917C3
MALSFTPHLRGLVTALFLAALIIMEPMLTTGIKLYKDTSFPVFNKVMGRNITCDAHIPGEYPGPTWTCADMRVDGLRVAYGYHPRVSVSGFCTDTGGRENLGAICRGLLWANQITKTFWAASVSEATCATTEQKRAIVIEEDRDFYWKDFKSGRGWMITIHCTTKPDEK